MRRTVSGRLRNRFFLVRMAGQAPVPAGPAGPQPGRGHCPDCTDIDFRTGLLLGHLPFGNNAGRHFPYQFDEEGQEGEVPLVTGGQMAEIQHIGIIHHCPCRRPDLSVGAAGTLQRIRPHCDISRPAGPSDRHHCRSDPSRGRHSGLDWRKNLLQYSLSGGNRTEFHLEILPAQTCHRCGQMPELPRLRA